MRKFDILGILAILSAILRASAEGATEGLSARASSNSQLLSESIPGASSVTRDSLNIQWSAAEKEPSS